MSEMRQCSYCSICGSARCIGKYLLHPKEMIFIPRIEAAERAACKERTFRLVDSPSSGEVFTRFKELHVTAGPDEDPNNITNVKVYVEDLMEQIKQGRPGSENGRVIVI